jgi:hypothetical protein
MKAGIKEGEVIKKDGRMDGRMEERTEGGRTEEPKDRRKFKGRKEGSC